MKKGKSGNNNEQLNGADKAQALLASIVASSDDAIIGKTLDGIIISWNMGATKLYGYTEEEAIGKPMSILMPPDVKDEPPDFLNRAKHGERIGHFETLRKRKDGKLIDVSLSISPIRSPDGTIIGVSAIAHDITGRKSAEEAIMFASAYNRSLIEASLDPLVTISPEGVITDVNKATEAATGFPRERLIGTDFSIYFTRPDRAHEGYLQVFNEGVVTDYPLEIRHKDGHITPVVYNASLYRDETGRVIGVFAAARDVTELIRTEKALKAKMIEVERSNAELEQFAYVASHDLQEPLRVVATCVNLLDRRYGDKLDANAHEFIGYAVEGSTRMQQMINDLLTFSRVGTKGKPFKRTDLESIFDRVLANLSISARDCNASITHDPLPTVVADGLQMTQLFQNLVGNAIKFRSKDRPPVIHVSVKRLDDSWEFAVSDNGIGIEPEYFNRIFIIFNRLHTIDEYPGSGIGLALCKKIVERHEGRIRVESRPGEGSTFSFTVPVRTE